MFLARGIAVSLAVFFVLYGFLSLATLAVFEVLSRVTKASVPFSAGVIFTLRILPFAGSAFFTLLLAVPSFYLLEPRGGEEDLGVVPAILALGCVSLFAAGILRAFFAHTRTAQVVAGWLENAIVLQVSGAATVFQSTQPMPPLIAAGIRKPKLLVSGPALAVLTPAELSNALRHELAHVHSRDNLKKLLFLCSPFPGMKRMESAWAEAAEIAADDAAVTNSADAVDLAAALIKLSRLGATPAQPHLTMGLIHDSPLTTRVERLLHWETAHSASGLTRAWYVVPTAAVVSTTCVALSYSAALTQLHLFTEWLVR